MRKLPISFIQDLRNREFYVLISSIVQLLLDSEIKNSTLDKATHKLQSREGKLLVLKETKPRHYITPKITERVTNRTEYLTCLRLKIEAALLSPIPEERVAGKRLKLWIDPYKAELFRPSVGVQGQLVEFLQYDRYKGEDIRHYTRLLHLDHIMDTLTETTREIKALVKSRIKDKTHRAVNGKEVRKEAYRDLQVILSVMKSIYSLTDSDEEKEEVTKLNDVINHTITQYRRELRSRATKKKNKSKKDEQAEQVEVEAKKTEEEEEEEGNPATTQGTSPTPITTTDEVDKKLMTTKIDNPLSNVSHNRAKISSSKGNSNDNVNSKLSDDGTDEASTKG